MSWNDQPTKAQLDVIRSWMDCDIRPSDLVDAAIEYLSIHATRKDASNEITRLRELHYTKRLDADSCFASAIWDGFDHQHFKDEMLRKIVEKCRRYHD